MKSYFLEWSYSKGVMRFQYYQLETNQDDKDTYRIYLLINIKKI